MFAIARFREQRCEYPSMTSSTTRPMLAKLWELSTSEEGLGAPKSSLRRDCDEEVGQYCRLR